jgi:arabinosaccharide transport system substrate-binding protein
MSFPYGRAPLGILLITLLAVAGVALTGNSSHGRRKPDLIFAVFSKEHATAYEQALPAFEATHNCIVDVQVVDPRALQSRLQSAIQVGADVPDMVELMDGSMSFFIKGRVEDVGLVDLTARLRESGLHEKLVANRFSKWSSRGRIFALPHDVHPTMLAYRKDIVQQLGIDVTKLTTWDEFARAGREIVTKDLDGDGTPDRYMVDLPADGGDVLQLLAMQRGGQFFDEAGEVAFDSDAFADAICWYVRQSEGDDRISFPVGWGQNLAKAMSDGLVLFYFCPDWRTMQFEMDVPNLKGKLGLMALPAWEPGGVRTSTWGGTGLVFPKGGRNFELAWKLAQHLYYDDAQLGPRFEQTNILPPLKTAWAQPEFHKIDDYWEISLGEAFVPLADSTPPAPSHAYYFSAVSKLSTALTRARTHYRTHGEDGLRRRVREDLRDCAAEVRRMIRRNVFLREDQQVAAAAAAAAAAVAGAAGATEGATP